MKHKLAKEIGPPPWTIRQHLTHARRMLIAIIWYGDTTIIRVLLGAASFWFGVFLLCYRDTFARTGFTWMAWVAPQWVWALLFLAYTVALIWRFVAKESNLWGFAVNGYGFALWGIYTGLLLLSVGEFSPGAAAEITMVAGAFLTLVRTGKNDELVSP